MVGRRSFLASLAAALVAPTVWARAAPELPEDVWCARCGAFQLPDHISADGMAYHTAHGGVRIHVEAYDDRLVQTPWPVHAELTDREDWYLPDAPR